MLLQTQRLSRQLTLNHRKHYSTLSSLLNLCKNLKYLKQLHARFILHGLHQNSALSSQLMDSYTNLNRPNLSLLVFNSITNPSCDLYNVVLRNLYKAGDFERTLLVYRQMNLNSVSPDEETCTVVLKACCASFGIEIGRVIHGQVVKLGLEGFDVVVRGLVETYRKCGDFCCADKLVERMPAREFSEFGDRFILEGNERECRSLSENVEFENVGHDSDRVIELLRLSVGLGSLRIGRAVHCFAVLSNLCGDISVNTAILSMYSKLGCLEDARLLFESMLNKDCVVWNIMITMFSRHGGAKESLELLRCMAKSGVRPDLFTAIPALSAITQLKSIDWGKQMHAHVLRNGSDYQVSVHNSLIDMYCECHHLRYAQRTFDLLRDKSVISWSSMMKGYINHSQSLQALSLFSKMRREGTSADFITIINILPACVNIGALEQVKYLHGYSMKLGLSLLSSVNTALLVSYAKCGCIEMAQRLFDEENIDSKDIIAWNSMINAYAKHGDCSRCFLLYGHMKHLNLRPDHVTFLGLLTACVNSGLVKEGQQCYKEMTEMYGLQPSQEHYACMVDLLGRAGHIEEARKLINSMPFKPDARVWGPLLSACKLHSKAELAEFAAEKLIELEPNNAGNYILLSNIYAATANWKGVAKMRSFLKDRGLRKTPGCSWLEINGHLHEFRVADQSHQRASDIYGILGILESETVEARKKKSRFIIEGF